MTPQNLVAFGAFLTGVVYDDLTIDDDLYSTSEGLRGILVTIEDTNSNKTFTTTTKEDGSYEIALDAGTYDVTFSIGGVAISPTQTVTINANSEPLNLNTDFLVDIPDFDDSATITGTTAADDLIGGDSDQEILGLEGNDRIYSHDGNDTIQGNRGNDLLVGGLGSDLVSGGADSDIIYGANPVKPNPGYLEADDLRGGGGADLFVLGDGAGAYYNFGGTRAEGTQDKATILDFTNEDKIQLYGDSRNYTLLETSNGNTKIFYGEPGAKTELIGVIRGVTGLNLDSSTFLYVNNESVIDGNANNNFLYGGDTNQEINGKLGDDLLSGGAGDDTLRGGSGNDILVGVNAIAISLNPGAGEIDKLSGGSGFDVFVLGDANGSYYDDNAGQDKAIILDYEFGDFIRLSGSMGDYQLNETNGSTQILQGGTELIGVVRDTVGLDLSSPLQFTYTG